MHGDVSVIDNKVPFRSHRQDGAALCIESDGRFCGGRNGCSVGVANLDRGAVDRDVVEQDQLRVPLDKVGAVTFDLRDRVAEKNKLLELPELDSPVVHPLEVRNLVPFEGEVFEIRERLRERRNRTDSLEVVVRKRHRVHRLSFLFRRLELLVGDQHECGEHFACCAPEVEEPILLQQLIFAELREVQKL